MTPLRENTILFRSSQQLPLSLSQTLEGFFELTRRTSRALALPHTLLLELQRYKDNVRCAALGAEVPGQHQEQLTQTLIVCLLKTHLVLLLQKLGGPRPPVRPPPSVLISL